MPKALIDPSVPSSEEAMLARTAHHALENSIVRDEALHLQIAAAGKEVTALDLPPIVTRLLLDVLKETASGKAVSLVSVDAEITTQRAAAILNVSRPYLIGMIDKGLLPSRMVGNQRRLPLQDVLAYKADNRAKRREVLREMTALDEELGLLESKPTLDKETENAAHVFMKRLEGQYPVIEGIVFGSRARGDHKADSDADIAVILKGNRGDRYKVSGDMAGIAFDVMMETGILVQAVPLWEDELKQPEQFSNPALIANIKREGLRL